MLIPFIIGIYFFPLIPYKEQPTLHPNKEGNFLQVSLGLQTNLCACFKLYVSLISSQAKSNKFLTIHSTQ